MLGFTYEQTCKVYNIAKKLAQDNCENDITLSKEDLSTAASSYDELSAFFIESYNACFNEKKAILNARNRIIDKAEKLGQDAAQKGHTKESSELATLKEPLNLSYQLFCDAFNEGFDNHKLGNPSQSLLGRKLKKTYQNTTKTAEMPAQKQPKKR